MVREETIYILEWASFYHINEILPCIVFPGLRDPLVYSKKDVVQAAEVTHGT